METETEFKFEPIWVTVLSLFTFFIIYTCVGTFIKSSSIDIGDLLLFILPALLSWFILPMLFLMLRGIPAVALSKDYLVDNVGGFSIAWGDISSINYKEGGYRTTGSIVINLKNPEKYYNTPLKAMWYKLSQLFTSNDINLRLDFVAGKNDTIFQLVNAYWDKHSGS